MQPDGEQRGVLQLGLTRVLGHELNAQPADDIHDHNHMHTMHMAQIKQEKISTVLTSYSLLTQNIIFGVILNRIW